MTATTPQPDPHAELAHDLRIACMRLARRVRLDADNTLPPHLFSVLVRLEEQPRTVGELAAIERVSAPSMSKAVGRVVELGYAVRSADEHDGRLVRLALSEEGVAAIRRERCHRDRWMTERLEALSEGERETLRAAAALLEGLMRR